MLHSTMPDPASMITHGCSALKSSPSEGIPLRQVLDRRRLAAVEIGLPVGLDSPALSDGGRRDLDE